MRLNEVQSWGYILPGTGSNGFDPVQATNTDLLLLSGFETATQIRDLQSGGPHGSRLVMGYVDITELGTYLPDWNPAYDVNKDGRPDAGAPDWLANANGAFPDLYTANYWTASWRNIVYRLIDEQMAKGYDGIFLDAVTFQAFVVGNRFGNAVRTTAEADIVQLVKDIEHHIAVDKGRPDFLIVGNQIHDLFRNAPELTTVFDAIVIEGSYWNSNPSNGLAFGPPTDPVVFDAVRRAAEPFAATGKPIFAVDYVPQSSYGTTYTSGNVDYNTEYFRKVIAAGYIGTLTHPFQRSIEVANFPNYVFGNSSADTITGLDTGQQDFLWGGSGNDSISGRSGPDVIWSGEGSDTVSAGTGNDTIDGGGGVSYLRGDEGNDSLIGGSDFDDINGNAGNDTVSTGAGEDYCVGGKDNDSLSGGADYDLVYGNLGDDTCNGDDGNDIVRGGQGNDVVNGGNGNDFVSGDKGDDTMIGGAGADIFHTFGDAGIDRVTDFNLAQGDRVQLDPGTQFTVIQVGADTVINMTGGGQMTLVGIAMSSLTTGWIFGA